MGDFLKPETQKLIEQRMQETGIGTADELVRMALQALEPTSTADFEDLDPETQAALEAAIAQADQGRTVPWDVVRRELTRRFVHE